MHPSIHNKRILAIALRSRRLVFAVFEGPDRLLDWGTVLYPVNDPSQCARAKKQIVLLFERFTPSKVVMGKARLLDTRKNSGIHPILRLIRSEASSRRIPARLLRRADIRRVFGTLHLNSKYEIASMLAHAFPELLWRLPPKRKPWQSEHPRMAMFDAIAFGFAYWMLGDEHEPTAD